MVLRMGQVSATGPFFFEARVSVEYPGFTVIDLAPAEVTRRHPTDDAGRVLGDVAVVGRSALRSYAGPCMSSTIMHLLKTAAGIETSSEAWVKE